MSGTEWVVRTLEAVLFLADEPVTSSDLAQLVELPAARIDAVLTDMSADYLDRQRGIVLRRVAGGWRLSTHPEAAPYLERFVKDQRSTRISQAALETLAIIAYRQPISRSQLNEIRGVNCDRAVRALSLAGVIEELSRDEGPGRAILYGTTSAFLEKAGLDSLSDLPPLVESMPDASSVERMEAGLGPGM